MPTDEETAAQPLQATRTPLRRGPRVKFPDKRRIWVDLETSQHDALVAYAEAHNVTLSDAVRVAVGILMIKEGVGE